MSQYKLIVIDLSKKSDYLKQQQINLIGRLEQNATIFFIIEKDEETTVDVSHN